MKNIVTLFLAFLFFSCNNESVIENNFDSFMIGQNQLFNFNGNVLVAQNGHIIYQKSFGFADFNTQEKLNDSSIFELASVSKQFTAMGILILFELDKIKLNDSLRRFFPDLPYNKITINHLLTHTSGLPDYADLIIEKWDHSKIAFNSDMINLFIKESPPILFNPGEKCVYSNTGYAILASIIEKVSGKPYRDFMSENIFQPLKMTNSFIYNSRRSTNVRIPNYAYGFMYSDSLDKYMLPDSLPGMEFIYFLDGIQGDGCVNSTTSDLFKWDRALKNCTLVSRETMSKMISPHALIDTVNEVFYGYGFRIGKDENGNYISHSGGWPGYLTTCNYFPQTDVSIIVLSNNQSPTPYIANSLANIAHKQKVINPYKHQDFHLDSISLDKFVGTFQAKNVNNNMLQIHNNFKIVRNGDKLFYLSDNGGKKEFKPESKNMIYNNEGLDIQFEIVNDANGPVRFYQILYGRKIEIKKINIVAGR